MSSDAIARIRDELAKTDAAGAVLSTQDNIFYASAFASVMDGWHLIEPIAAVFVPTDSALPVVPILPEASIISVIVSQRGGYPVHYDRLATFDMLNFCETARAEDAHLALPKTSSPSWDRSWNRLRANANRTLFKPLRRRCRDTFHRMMGVI